MTDYKALIAQARAIVERDFTHPRYSRGEAVQLHSILDALEAATVAPAVDREALAQAIVDQAWADSDPHEIADAVIAHLGARDVRAVQS